MVKFDQFLLLGAPRKLWVIEPMFVPDFGLGEPKGYGAGGGKKSCVEEKKVENCRPVLFMPSKTYLNM